MNNKELLKEIAETRAKLRELELKQMTPTIVYSTEKQPIIDGYQVTMSHNWITGVLTIYNK